VTACRGAYLSGFIWLLGTNTFALFIPWLLKLSIDSLERPGTSAHSPAWYAAAIMIAALFQGVIRIFSRTTLLHAGRRIEYMIREDLYAKLMELDLPFFSRERTGDIMSRFSNDLTNVRMLLGFGMLNVINTAIVYLAALFLMAKISIHLTLWAILPFPVTLYIVKSMSASMFRRSQRVQEELSQLTSKVEENVSAATVIKSYCREDAETASFAEICSAYLACNMAMARIRGAMIPIMAASGAMGTLIVLFVGGSRVISHELTLGDFVAFNGYLAMLVWPTLMLAWILNLIQRGAASMSRLNQILEAKATVREPAQPEPATITGSIEIRDLSFSYGNSTISPELSHISLTIKKGTRLGIVGPIGCGKSTLVRLLPRLYPVADGHIFLDGVDINRIPLGQLRRAIGFVPQESFLFSRTIGDNIAYGQEGATEEEIENSARMSGIAPDIMRFADSYKTLVGERGVTLSGGQKQRTAIARALLKNPPILILDDPLSAVDARTEEEILANLSAYYGERTVIIVSHRLSALRDCGLIIVMDGGRIVEQGSHGELLAMNGRYAAIHHEQQLRREIEGY
jgi:ATP-binding cassette subfamily B protein